jgi:hypothetical protein
VSHPNQDPALRPACGCYADDPACPHRPLSDAVAAAEAAVAAATARGDWDAVAEAERGLSELRSEALADDDTRQADLGGRGDVWECSVCGDGYEAYSLSHATHRHDDEDGSHEPVWLP